VDLANQLTGLQIAWYSWWQSNCVKDLAERYKLRPMHASWMEAFPFTRVAELPKGEKTPVEARSTLNAAQTRQAYGDGVFGGSYEADASIMSELFNLCLEDVLYLLRFD
jgi:creatinine amidohydrolase